MTAARSLDKELESVIARAVKDPAYRRLLKEDRAAALEQADLCPAVQSLVMSVKTEQLEKMIDRASKGGDPDSPGGVFAKTIKAGLLVGGGLVAGAMFFAATATTGHSAGVSEEFRTSSLLHQLAVAQAVYKMDYGTYVSLEDLLDRGYIELQGKSLEQYSGYNYEIVLDGDAFTITARHATRPDTRRAFIVGPDGEVRELPRTDE